ncbi:MAG TPA: VWA domain-containing protein [Thermoanaerobaculia bacterium]|nr:VWA domain-containing protein [Thermoanaerobaculia bacterium]
MLLRPLGFAAALFGLAALSGAPLFAQAQAPTPPPAETPENSFGEEIQVNVVNLDVFVSDKQGKPVEGLKAGDFTVLEDGKPVKVTNFYTEKREPAKAEAAAEGGKAPAERPLDQRLRLVIFVDDVNIQPDTRGTILDRVGPFLRRELQPGDEVMLVRYTGKLEIRRSFTSDVGQIEADIAVLRGQSSDMRKYEESLESAFDDIVDAIYTSFDFVLVEQRVRAWAEQESAVVRGAVSGLDGVVGWLAGVPGRKAILYVSDGLPLRPGEDIFQWAAAYSRFGAGRISPLNATSLDLSKRFREVTAHASRNRITIYPIEAYGTRVERGTQLQEYLVSNRQDGLRFLAQDTGGQAMLNAADPAAALRRMGDDLTTFYSLGYTPNRPGDDAEHKVEVKVKDKGLHVRHRQWYRDKPVGETVAERTLAVMRFGPEDNPLGASLEIQPAKEQNGASLVPVRVTVPVAKLFLQPKEKGRAGRLRLYVVASTGGMTTPVKETKVVTVELPEAEAAAGSKREYVHDVGIPLQAGSWSIGVAVRDELAATTSYLRKDFVVPAGQKGK